MAPEDRNLNYLKSKRRKINATFKTTKEAIVKKYPEINPILPDEIKFIHAEELLQMYPDLSPKKREHRIAKLHGAVFIIGIGGELSNGSAHDGRAPDYDDWSTPNCAGYHGLNGDFIVWNPVLEIALEISSMGIRVDQTALLRQLTIRDDLARKNLYFHQLLLAGEMPQSIGGGIGQSRVCMFMLRKHHIGEVQVSVWPEEARIEAEEKGIRLL